MTGSPQGFVREDNPREIETLLDSLTLPGGASLQFVEADARPMPVLLSEQRPGLDLLLDITAIRDVRASLERGQPFRLLGQSHNKMLQTPPLIISDARQVDGRLTCTCPYPAFLEVMHRRDTFRATLQLSMQAWVKLWDAGHQMLGQGELQDLSLGGCRIELSIGCAGHLTPSQPLALELGFPDGTRFSITALPRHHVADTDRQRVSVGFAFASPTPDEERQLWFLVSEIEREAARRISEEGVSLLPSALFQPAVGASIPLARESQGRGYATPMAKRLASVAGYLDTQLLELQQESGLNSMQLSQHADQLLSLHDEDRESLLFATRCMNKEPRVVRHGLAVASRLLDLAAVGGMPQGTRKAVVASAMVHDLGKALLPDTLLASPRLDESGRAEMQAHVSLLRGRLQRCHWLSSSVVDAVVEQINERLDGSGYPLGLTGARLGELARLAMVVDAVDAMGLDRPDRPAWKVADIYRYLLGHPQHFDQRWVKRYIKHFGLWPIGSLVRFKGGELGWIQRLDRHGALAQVQLTDAAGPPEMPLGEVLRERRLDALGPPQEEVPAGS